jgi:predicted short-subunit dehydrogenase-like oxidoreductase (DUF2520 family)
MPDEPSVVAVPVMIVGAGRLGTSLALALADTPFTVCGVWNRSPGHAAWAASQLGRPVASGPLLQAPGLTEADLVLVCVNDAAIPALAETLAAAPLRPTAVVAHTSGCLAAAALAPLSPGRTASIHPLCVCAEPRSGQLALRRALYAIEGEASASLVPLAEALSGRVARLAQAQKPRYHAAAVLASNLVVALLDHAVNEATAAGLSPDRAQESLVDLAIGALERLRSTDATRALTGPVSRGDVDTVARHLQVLEGATRVTYQHLSRHALRLAARGNLPPQAYALLEAMLDT